MKILWFFVFLRVCLSAARFNPNTTQPLLQSSYELSETESQSVELGSQVILRCRNSITQWTRLTDFNEIVLKRTVDSRLVCAGSLCRSDGQCRDDVNYDAVDGRYIRFLSITMKDAGIYTCHSKDVPSRSIRVRVINRRPPQEDGSNQGTHQAEDADGRDPTWFGVVTLTFLFLIMVTLLICCCKICRGIAHRFLSPTRRCSTCACSPCRCSLLSPRRESSGPAVRIQDLSETVAIIPVDVPPTYAEVISDTRPLVAKSETTLEVNNDELLPSYTVATHKPSS